jgi:hypothetical protein
MVDPWKYLGQLKCVNESYYIKSAQLKNLSHAFPNENGLKEVFFIGSIFQLRFRICHKEHTRTSGRNGTEWMGYINFTTASTMALRPTQSPVQWYQGLFPWE